MQTAFATAFANTVAASTAAATPFSAPTRRPAPFRGEFATPLTGDFLLGFEGDFHAHFAPAPAAAPTDLAAMAVEGFAVALHDIAQRIGAGDAAAGPALRRLLAEMQAHPDPRCTGLVVFGAAMAQRLADGSGAEANLYLRQFEVPQIHLFNLLGRAVPFVGLATRIANDAIAAAIDGIAHPTLIDVGIGTGRQFALLIDELAAAGRLPQALTVIGIEPSAWALDEARATLEAAATRHGLPLQFFGFSASAEALEDTDWAFIAAACSAAPVVNASFALHHIADDADGRDLRNTVLRRLQALAPRQLVLAEPDVDHLEPRFFQRFQNCFAHFGAVFRTLDALPLDQADRDALKVGFFGREIADILSTPEARRSERHESAASWAQRLATTGFALLPAPQPLPASPSAAVAVVHRGQRMALQAGDEPVVAIFCAAPRAAA